MGGSYMPGANMGVTAGAAAAAMISEAVKACGSLVEVTPDNFERIISTVPDGLYVECRKSPFFGKKRYHYLTNYGGLFFHCKSSEPLWFPDTAEVITAKKMSVPSL